MCGTRHYRARRNPPSATEAHTDWAQPVLPLLATTVYDIKDPTVGAS